MEQVLSSLVSITSPILRYAASQLFQAVRGEIEQRASQRRASQGGPAARYAERFSQAQRTTEQDTAADAEEAESEGAAAEAVIEAAEAALRSFEPSSSHERDASPTVTVRWTGNPSANLLRARSVPALDRNNVH